MKKLLNRFPLIFLLFLQAALCPIQSKGQAQKLIPNELAEEVFVHLSDQVVVTGDELWAAITVLLNGQPSPSVVAYLELMDREGNPVKREMIQLEGGKGEGYLKIPENSPSDNYLLRVYTRNSPYFSKSKGVFHQIISVINPQLPPTIDGDMRSESWEKPVPSETAQIQTNKESYRTREDVSLRIRLKPFTAFTLSVSRLTPLHKDLSPEIEWEMIYEAGKGRNIFIPEIYGHIIQGKSLATRIDTTATFYVSAHGDHSNLFMTKASSEGNLFFETGTFKHFDFVIVQSSTSEDQVDFILESPFYDGRPSAAFTMPELRLTAAEKDFILDQVLSRSVREYYYPYQSLPTAEVPPLLNPDRTYLLNDYNRFDDMATTFREYVPDVFVRRRGGEITFRTLNIPFEGVFRGEPLLLIDAMPVFDSDAVARFNPKDIKKLEVVNRHYFSRKDVYEGVISLTSFENDFGRFPLPKNALFIEYPGIQVPKRIKFPENTDKRLPDFRNLLTWETGQATDEKGEASLTFTTSELQGYFEIRLSFLNEKDQLTEIKEIIEVK